MIIYIFPFANETPFKPWSYHHLVIFFYYRIIGGSKRIIIIIVIRIKMWIVNGWQPQSIWSILNVWPRQMCNGRRLGTRCQMFGWFESRMNELIVQSGNQHARSMCTTGCYYLFSISIISYERWAAIGLVQWTIKCKCRSRMDSNSNVVHLRQLSVDRSVHLSTDAADDDDDVDVDVDVHLWSPLSLQICAPCYSSGQWEAKLVFHSLSPSIMGNNDKH